MLENLTAPSGLHLGRSYTMSALKIIRSTTLKTPQAFILLDAVHGQCCTSCNNHFLSLPRLESRSRCAKISALHAPNRTTIMTNLHSGELNFRYRRELLRYGLYCSRRDPASLSAHVHFKGKRSFKFYRRKTGRFCRYA